MPANAPVVVHVSTAHHWDDSRIFRRMCLSLARDGHDVVLLAVGEPGREAEQEVDDVRVVPLAAGGGRVSRVLVRVPRAAVRSLGIRAAVYHLHDPELIPLIPLLRLRGAKVIYDAHEDLGRQILEKEYIPPRVRPAVAALGRALCAVADRTSHHVVAASTTVAEGFRERRCTIVRNYPEDVVAAHDVPDHPDRQDMAVYAGGLTRARGVEQMVDAMLHPGLPAGWRLRLVGPHSPDDFVDRLRTRPGWSRVEYSGAVPPNDARRMMASCKVGLAVLQPIGQNVDVLPTKLFEYMSLGIPVVAAAYPQIREVVEGARCGLVVDPTDPAAIGSAIAHLATRPDEAREMGERGRAEAVTRFSWRSEERRLLATYSQLLAGAESR